MRKIKFSDINKRNLTLLGLVVVVAVAGVINLRMSGAETTETLAPVENNAELTEIETTTSDAYTEAILLRDQKRSESMDVYREIVDSTSYDKETKDNAQAMLTKSANYINDETVIQTLAAAKGIEKCVVYIDEASVNIVVFDHKLTDLQANQLKDIVMENTNFTADKIKITENK